MLKIEFEDLGTGIELLGQQEEYAISDILDIKLEEVGELEDHTQTSLQISSKKRLKILQAGLDELIQRIGHNVERYQAARTLGDVKRLKNKTSDRTRRSSERGLKELQNELDELIISIDTKVSQMRAAKALLA